MAVVRRQKRFINNVRFDSLAKLEEGLFLHNMNPQIGIHLLKQVVLTTAEENQEMPSSKNKQCLLSSEIFN